MKKAKKFTWLKKCAIAWKEIKEQYHNAFIFISCRRDMKFYIHTNTSNIVLELTLAQNLRKKCDQSISYASILLNSMKKIILLKNSYNDECFE